jgi:hypothetical protein
MSPVRISSLLLTEITIGDGGVWFRDTILLMGNGWLYRTRCRIWLGSSRTYRDAKPAPTSAGIFVTQASAIRSMSRLLIWRARGVTSSSSELPREAPLSRSSDFLIRFVMGANVNLIPLNYGIFFDPRSYRPIPWRSLAKSSGGPPRRL